jgi:hypothetical protein
MTENEQIKALTIKVSEAAKGSQLGVILRAFGRMARVLADTLNVPLDEMLELIIEEATEIKPVVEETQKRRVH